jgi:hypothetical protein
MSVAFLFGDIKFATGLVSPSLSPSFVLTHPPMQFPPMMTMLALGMFANVCIDITEVSHRNSSSLPPLSDRYVVLTSSPVCGRGTKTMT